MTKSSHAICYIYQGSLSIFAARVSFILDRRRRRRQRCCHRVWISVPKASSSMSHSGVCWKGRLTFGAFALDLSLYQRRREPYSLRYCTTDWSSYFAYFLHRQMRYFGLITLSSNPNANFLAALTTLWPCLPDPSRSHLLYPLRCLYHSVHLQLRPTSSPIQPNQINIVRTW